MIRKTGSGKLGTKRTLNRMTSVEFSKNQDRKMNA